MRAGYGTSCALLLLLIVLATPSHAAGVWYLMYPPDDPPPKDNRSPVPLRAWITYGSYNSANECEMGRVAEMRVAELKFARASEAQATVKSGVYNDPILVATKRWLQFAESYQKQMWASLCIASNDSRLADPRGPKGK